MSENSSLNKFSFSTFLLNENNMKFIDNKLKVIKNNNENNDKNKNDKTMIKELKINYNLSACQQWTVWFSFFVKMNNDFDSKSGNEVKASGTPHIESLVKRSERQQKHSKITEKCLNKTVFTLSNEESLKEENKMT